jgi:Flp pilus assembly protein TadG
MSASETPSFTLKLAAAGVLAAAVADGVRSQDVIGCSAVAVSGTDWQITLTRAVPTSRRIVHVSADVAVGQPFTGTSQPLSDTSMYVSTVTAAGAQSRAPQIRFSVWEMVPNG